RVRHIPPPVRREPGLEKAARAVRPAMGEDPGEVVSGPEAVRQTGRAGPRPRSDRRLPGQTETPRKRSKVEKTDVHLGGSVRLPDHAVHIIRIAMDYAKNLLGDIFHGVVLYFAHPALRAARL